MADPVPFITRVRLRNYRSIPACDVRLGPLTFLVGPNGSGKSSFLDALRLIVDSLRTSLDHALRDRGGVKEVRRRAGHPTNFTIRIDFQLGADSGHFSFEVGARANGFVVKSEECVVGQDSYLVRDGEVVRPPGPIAPPAADDRLYLVNAAGLPPFRRLFDVVSTMGFYSLNPDRIRALQPPDKGELLARDGSNLASVLERLKKEDGGEAQQRIQEYLGKIVPGLEGVEPKRLEHMETIEFTQEAQGAKRSWRFPAINMSDGTLRALGILVALFQARVERKIKVVGIEEPEVALHPSAAGVLRDALREGARHAQVLVTSHSPELLDDPRVLDHEILSVVSQEGETVVAPLDEIARSALRDHLYTAGELLRADQLTPDASSVPTDAQLNLFELDPR